MLGTQRGTRFANVIFSGWRGLVTGGGGERAGELIKPNSARPRVVKDSLISIKALLTKIP